MNRYIAIELDRDDDGGNVVFYSDHLKAIAEKDAKIRRLKRQCEELIWGENNPDKYESELKGFRDIVNKYPTTADGVPMTLHMNLYSPQRPVGFGIIGIFEHEYGPIVRCRDLDGDEFDMEPSDCYSTLEAAEKAGEL